MDDGEMHRRIVGYGVRVLGVSFRTEAPDSPVLRSLDNDGFFARKLRDTAQLVLHVHVRRSQGGIWAPDEDGNIDAFLSGVGARVHETCMIAHAIQSCCVGWRAPPLNDLPRPAGGARPVICGLSR